MWRDAGYGVGAIVLGTARQTVNLEAAFYLAGALMLVSGGLVYLWMVETHPAFGTHTPPAPVGQARRFISDDRITADPAAQFTT